jgi:hypothetical protein
MQEVFRHNTDLQRTVLTEFERVRKARGLSQEAAVKAIKMNGGIVSRQNLTKFKNGYFNTASNTYLNILSCWSGYPGLVELVNAVERRKCGEIEKSV